MKQIGLLIIVNFLILSCYVKVKESRVVGEIELSNLFEKNEINLKDLDQYIHSFYSKDMIFIGDNFHKKIMGFDHTGRIRFLLGKTGKEDTVLYQENIALIKQVQDFYKVLNLDSQKMNKIFYPQVQKDRFSINEFYTFHNIIDFTVDLEGNLYVLDQTKEKIESSLAEFFILKFSPKGKFLYRIGQMGRDNLPFRGDFKFEKMVIRSQEQLWIQYHDAQGQYIRGYNDFGKNIFLFESNKVKGALRNILKNEKIKHYLIEGIFAGKNGDSVFAVVNLVNTKEAKIFEKRIYEFSRKYFLVRQSIFDHIQFQSLAIDWHSHFIGFGKPSQPNMFFFKWYSLRGKYIGGKNLTLQGLLYRHLNFRILENNAILGSFIRENQLVFVLWE